MRPSLIYYDELYDMNFHNQDRSCVVTPPRSEGSVSMGTEMLRCAQHDRTGFDCENSLSVTCWINPHATVAQLAPALVQHNGKDTRLHVRDHWLRRPTRARGYFPIA